jgi:hypothetical protein
MATRGSTRSGSTISALADTGRVTMARSSWLAATAAATSRELPVTITSSMAG